MAIQVDINCWMISLQTQTNLLAFRANRVMIKLIAGGNFGVVVLQRGLSHESAPVYV